MNIYVYRYEGSNGLALFRNKIIKRLKYARKKKNRKKREREREEAFNLLAWNKVPRALDFLVVGKFARRRTISVDVI